MEKRKYYTVIRKEHKLGENLYVIGVVSGLRFALCEDKDSYPWGNGEIEEGYILVTECTSELYENFTKRVEEIYPGLCIFDYKKES